MQAHVRFEGVHFARSPSRVDRFFAFSHIRRCANPTTVDVRIQPQRQSQIYPKFLHVYPPSFNTADSDEAAVGDEMIVRTNFLNEALADTRGRRSIRAARWLKKILLP
jgi:hypothetical protein